VPELVVADTSPLLALHAAECLTCLPALFQRVLIPPAVVQELEAGLLAGKPGPRLSNLDWVEIRASSEDPRLTADPQAQRLGAGERAAMSLAALLTVPVLIDDREARRQAQRMGLVVVGAVGLLLRAKKAGVLSAVAPALARMSAGGFRLDQSLRDQVLIAAGE